MQHTCPVWIGHLLAHPVRKLFHCPKRILSPFVKPNMTVVDLGSAMGFFSIPLAKMVAPQGRVICLDVQQEMLEQLEHRACKAGVQEQIETRLCPHHTLGLSDVAGRVDFVLASAVIHELTNPAEIFRELYGIVHKDGVLYIVEPKAHVSRKNFEKSLDQAREAGFKIKEQKRNKATLIKPDNPFVKG